MAKVFVCRKTVLLKSGAVFVLLSVHSFGVPGHHSVFWYDHWELQKSKMFILSGFKGITSRISLKNKVQTWTKRTPLNHHLWPTGSVWWCLCLQRSCPLPGFSYFAAVFETFLGINLWAVRCSDQVTDCKDVGPAEALSLGGGANLNVAFTNCNQQIFVMRLNDLRFKVF